jgi:hypothetical protein
MKLLVLSIIVCATLANATQEYLQLSKYCKLPEPGVAQTNTSYALTTMGNTQEQLIDKTLLCLKNSNNKAHSVLFLWACTDLITQDHPRHYSRPTREWLLHKAGIVEDMTNVTRHVRSKLLWTLADGVYSLLLKQTSKYSNTQVWNFIACSLSYGEWA